MDQSNTTAWVIGIIVVIVIIVLGIWWWNSSQASVSPTDQNVPANTATTTY